MYELGAGFFFSKKKALLFGKRSKNFCLFGGVYCLFGAGFGSAGEPGAGGGLSVVRRWRGCGGDAAFGGRVAAGGDAGVAGYWHGQRTGTGGGCYAGGALGIALAGGAGVGGRGTRAACERDGAGRPRADRGADAGPAAGGIAAQGLPAGAVANRHGGGGGRHAAGGFLSILGRWRGGGTGGGGRSGADRPAIQSLSGRQCEFGAVFSGVAGCGNIAGRDAVPSV